MTSIETRRNDPRSGTIDARHRSARTEAGAFPPAEVLQGSAGVLFSPQGRPREVARLVALSSLYVMSERRPILGFENYSVSTGGEVRREVDSKTGSPAGRVLRQHTVRGYRLVWLYGDGSRKLRSVHRVLWEAFNGEIPDGLQVNHRNGDKLDNRLENLELVTPAENTRHAIDVLGRRRDGEDHSMAKVTEKDVFELRKSFAAGARSVELAERFGLSRSAVHRIVTGRTWTRAGGPISRGSRSRAPTR